jgi:hypothetical protein
MGSVSKGEGGVDCSPPMPPHSPLTTHHSPLTTPYSHPGTHHSLLSPRYSPLLTLTQVLTTPYSHSGYCGHHVGGGRQTRVARSAGHATLVGGGAPHAQLPHRQAATTGMSSCYQGMTALTAASECACAHACVVRVWILGKQLGSSGVES